MNETNEPIKRRSRRGQTMAEFALTLPVVLLLIFGVIEFARIFQAWITLQNAARVAVRAGVTGEWDPAIVGYYFGYTGPNDRGSLLASVVECSSSTDPDYVRHWGKDCDPTSDEDLGLRDDMARLPWIWDNARQGAAGLALGEVYDIVGLHKAGGQAVKTTAGPTENEAKWFHVWICSSRPKFSNPREQRYTLPDGDRRKRQCLITEPPMTGQNQYDAGGPGDLLEVVVFFNHPLITPIAFADYVPLMARRVGINEAFRSTRAVNLPPQLGLPTKQPTFTYTPSPIPSLTHTATASYTPTATYTFTPTVETPPSCAMLSITAIELVSNTLRVTVDNRNEATVYITAAFIQWRKHPQYQAMFADVMRVGTGGAHWDGTDTTPPTDVDSGSVGWNNSEAVRAFPGNPGGSQTLWRTYFGSAPPNLATYGYSIHDFYGSSITLSSRDGSVVCPLPFNLQQPTPDPNTPTFTHTPVCGDFTFRFGGFDTNGVVRFTIRNASSTPRMLTGFSIVWRKYVPAMALEMTSLGGASAFDAQAIRFWDGTSASPPTTVNEGGSGWQLTPTINGGQTLNFWVDFDGVTGSMPTNYGALPTDFNGSSITIDYVCPVPMEPVSGPVTPTATFTPTVTPTRTITPTRTPTNTPGPPTQTPTVTLTRTITLTPTITRTPTITLTPTITRTPTVTFTPTATRTRTPTPTVTNTPQATNTPTRTNTPTATNTSAAQPTATKTPTPKQFD
ncbi:MAG: pilus assembly protein [Anaerolineae bacterium]|nr:pilus assembly protein [Anaerolineae bacterium]